VREHRPESDVADALDARHARVELVVDHDAPARINFDTNVFEAEAVNVWSATDGDKDNIGLNLWTRLTRAYNKKARGTHRILLPVLRGLCRDDDLPILLLSREDLRA
jgi:hypothetical protein